MARCCMGHDALAGIATEAALRLMQNWAFVIPRHESMPLCQQGQDALSATKLLVLCICRSARFLCKYRHPAALLTLMFACVSLVSVALPCRWQRRRRPACDTHSTAEEQRPRHVAAGPSTEAGRQRHLHGTQVGVSQRCHRRCPVHLFGRCLLSPAFARWHENFPGKMPADVMCCAVNTSLASRHHISRADKPVMMLMVSAGAQAVVEAAQIAWHALIRAPVALQIVIAMTLLNAAPCRGAAQCGPISGPACAHTLRTAASGAASGLAGSQDTAAAHQRYLRCISSIQLWPSAYQPKAFRDAHVLQSRKRKEGEGEGGAGRYLAEQHGR